MADLEAASYNLIYAWRTIKATSKKILALIRHRKRRRLLQVYTICIELIFLCPHLPKSGVGNITFRRDVTSVLAYVLLSNSI